MKLVIIEGAGKKETIEKYLGRGYKVFATKGHVRDLPANTLAVNVSKNFEPKYSIMDDKKQIVKDLLSKAAEADEILLATDPDREGEAISWHLANILKIPDDKKARIEFNEISKKAVNDALEHPRTINFNLVDAQQARRVLDRLVGYKLSPVLCKKIHSRLSAGRVQSVTLRLIVDRERQIKAFIPKEFWTISASLTKAKEKSINFKAQLHSYKGKKFEVKDKQTADIVLDAIKSSDWTVANVKKSASKSHAPAPFITSSMQQDALNKLGMSLKQTTLAAQQLYEGVEIAGEGKVALVTYIRTDSTRVAPDAQKEAREFIMQKFGKAYVPEKPNIYAGKAQAQDAHEAIRPITLTRLPDVLKNSKNRNLYKLYKLIYDRFLASQMSEAIFDTVSVDIKSADYTFKANGKTPVFDGYLAAYTNFNEKDDDEDEKADKKLPELQAGDPLKLLEVLPQQKFTKPPARYTEASLIKAMEENGIGRPATYTPTITTLFSRTYTEMEGKFIVPTELGFNVNDMLIKYFPDVMDIGFTADMETKLDKIEEGGKVWQTVVGEFYNGLEEKIAFALDDGFTLKVSDRPSDQICEKCGANMVIKTGRYGEFLACPNYPKCKNIVNIEKDDQNSIDLKDVPPCEKCGAPMVQKSGRYGPFLSCSGYPECKNIRKIAQPATADSANPEVCDKCGAAMVEKSGRYGKFLACSAYPECKNIKNLKNNLPDDPAGICPDCGKNLRWMNSKKGTVFVSCTGYPECKFITNYAVANEKCPDCGSFMNTRKVKNGILISCGSKTCKYKKEEQPKDSK